MTFYECVDYLNTDCVLFVRSMGMYTELATPSVRKLYISETHNKHAGPYTCVELRQHQTLAHSTVTLLLYSKHAPDFRKKSCGELTKNLG